MPRVWEGARHCCRLQERNREKFVEKIYLIEGNEVEVTSITCDIYCVQQT